MIRVVITGSECTGKTTLAEALAGHFQTVWVPEYARQFVLDKGAPLEYGDVDRLARGQMELEDRLGQEARHLLVQDTDLLSTIVYSKHYYRRCPDWMETALVERRADLYLLADIDVPWVPDGEQRDRGHRREEMQALFRNALLDRGWPYHPVRGSLDERLKSALDQVRTLLASAIPTQSPDRAED